MIPKIIHYCWLSNDPYPEQIQRCMASWEKHLPDYKFVKWDTSRFDVNSVPYVKGAFEAGKYAFCADYIRIYALYSQGGIYLDSDVMIHKSLDPFLVHKSFSSVEYHPYFTYAHIRNKKEKLIGIEAAVIGAEAGCEWLKKVLEYYDGLKFSINEKNIMPRVIARVLYKYYGFEYLPIFQKLNNDFYIYPSEVFSSKIESDLLIKYSTHLGANSWGFYPPVWKKVIKKFMNWCGLLRVIQKLRGISKH